MIADLKLNGKWRSASRSGGSSVSYVKWRAILDRVSVRNVSCLTYKDCSISDNFKDFQYFAEWHNAQIGYGCGWHLDKDLLFPKNKQYSEIACVLLPPELNLFMRGSVARRGEFPQGVSYDKSRDSYMASIHHKNKAINLGRFSSPEAAHKKYCERKNEIAGEWVTSLSNGEYLVDDRVIDALKEWDTYARYN